MASTGPLFSSSPYVPAGGRVGRYQLCCRLAQGGMGTVYLARMEGPGRFAKLLALKVIHPYLADRPEVVEMFLEEARLASLINHPNVCSVLDFGHHEDNYFMTMEYLAGETVQDLIRVVGKRPEIANGPTWPAIALRIIMDACEGLHAAHELRGEGGEPLEVVHRDVSPSNVFVTFDGATKIVDFGIAKAADGARDKTQPGALKGRYRYMAPEQASNQKFDRRADVWALGVVLWELLMLRPLFDGDNEAQILMAVMRGEVPPPSKERPDLPPELDEIIAKALAQDPDERYATARELGRDLNRIMLLLPEPAGPAELAELMEDVFQERHAERFKLMEHARQLDSDVVLTLPEGGEGFEAQPTRLTAVPISQVRPAPGRPGESASASRKWLWVALSVLGAVLGVLGGMAVVMMSNPEAAAPSSDAVGASVAAATAPSGGEAGEPVAGADEGSGVQAAAQEEGAEPAEAEADEAALSIAPVTIGGVGDATADDEEATEGADGEGTEGAEGEGPEGAPEAGDEGEADEAAADSDESTPASERRRRRWARPSGPPGTVNVVTPGGWADIYVGGRRVGRSPASFELPPGRHVIELRPFGEARREREVVRVRSGERARVSVRVSR